MDGEQKFWLSLWAILGSTLVCVVALCWIFSNASDQSKIDAGMELRLVPSSVAVWAWVAADAPK